MNIENMGSSPIHQIIKTLTDPKLQNTVNKYLGGSIGVKLLNNINLHSPEYSPFVNGYYYIHLQSGTWVEYFKESKTAGNIFTTNISTAKLKKISQDSGTLIFNSDLPNLLLETETVSGRLRNINYATKTQIMGDFSISYHDTNNLDLNTYHIAWLKYIELLRRGDIKSNNSNDNNDYANSKFFDVPYYNAIWVLIFEPFSVKPIGIFKLLGVTPITLPLQNLLGDRGNPSIGLFNQTYKCNDMVFDLRGDTAFSTYENITLNTNSLFNKLLEEFTLIFDEKKGSTSTSTL